MSDEYIPSEEEVQQALADADEMNYNMRTYGTIDRPKMETQRCHWACTGCNICGSSGHGTSWF